MIGSRRHLALAAAIGALLALALALRIGPIALDADPDLHFGSDYLTDEGFYAKNARLFVEEGRWLRPGDNHNHVFLAPLQVGLNALAFWLDGVGLGSLRTVSAFGGLALVAFVAFFTQRTAGPIAALLAALFVTVDPALVHLSRVGLAEGSVTLAAALLFLTLARAPWHRHTPLLLAALLALAVLVKATALAVVPGVTLAYLGIGLSERRLGSALGRTAVALALGLSLAAACYATLQTSLPQARASFAFELGVHAGELRLPDLLATLGSALRTRHALRGLARSPGVAALALLGLAWVLLGAPRAHRRERRLAIALSAWAVSQALVFSAMPYQPFRYFLGLGAPAAVLAALILRAAVRPPRGEPRHRALAGLALAGWASASLVAHEQGFSNSRLLSLVIAGLCCAVLALAWSSGRRRLSVALVAALAAACALTRAARPLVAPTFTDAAARARVSAALGSHDMVAGFFADSFVLGSSARSVVIHGFWNGEGDPFTRFGVTKLLVTAQEERWMRDRWPELEPRLEPLASVEPAGGARGTLSLLELRPPRAE